MSREQFEAVMMCALNTTRENCQVGYKQRARGAGAALRGELTLEQVVHRENARVQNKQPDPEREKRNAQESRGILRAVKATGCAEAVPEEGPVTEGTC